VEISERIWWVGHYLPGDPFQCHAYLIEQGDESILIDPGSALTFASTLAKSRKLFLFHPFAILFVIIRIRTSRQACRRLMR